MPRRPEDRPDRDRLRERLAHTVHRSVDLITVEAAQADPGRCRRDACWSIATADGPSCYADLPAQRGAETYERAAELLTELPPAVAGIGHWIEQLWPPNAHD
jgi:hypothetical protein